jgi:NADPH:quinone reductase-like Zn-dependent oxidoreductase
VGLNPADYWLLRSANEPGSIIGGDVVGEVVALGDEINAEDVKLGEIRSAFVNAAVSGGFAE